MLSVVAPKITDIKSFITFDQYLKELAKNFTCTRSFMILDLYFKKSTQNFTCTRLQDNFFSVQLWFSVKIQRIRFVGFSVRRIISVEDIVRADVDHPTVNALCRIKNELVKKPILPLRFYGVVISKLQQTSLMFATKASSPPYTRGQCYKTCFARSLWIFVIS
jgi:hypothetical protein